MAATAEDGDGVFESQALLGAGAAAKAFNRLMWTADATMGMTGSTRYGTAARMTSENAKKDPDTSEYGAFSYSTMQETVRTQDAAAVSLTGIASYMGGTHAVNTKGKVYTGTMELQVRFKAESVSGVVSGLQDSDGLAWQHNFADVDRIVLDDGTLRRNAKWTHTGTAGSNATVFYARQLGAAAARQRPSPTPSMASCWARALTRGARRTARGLSEQRAARRYLAGAFGVEHVADTARPVPSEDDGSAATAMLFSMVADDDGCQHDHGVDRGRDADGEGAGLRLSRHRRPPTRQHPHLRVPRRNVRSYRRRHRRHQPHPHHREVRLGGSERGGRGHAHRGQRPEVRRSGDLDPYDGARSAVNPAGPGLVRHAKR